MDLVDLAKRIAYDCHEEHKARTGHAASVKFDQCDFEGCQDIRKLILRLSQIKDAARTIWIEAMA